MKPLGLTEVLQELASELDCEGPTKFQGTMDKGSGKPSMPPLPRVDGCGLFCQPQSHCRTSGPRVT